MNLKDERINIEDILIFSSHGENKKSYHIVINNWCLPDYYSNKVYCTKIINQIESPYKKYIDNVMYKNLQQFRIYGCTKYGKNRYKILESSHSNLQHSNKRCQEMLTIYASLITNTNTCKILEYTEKINKVYEYKKLNNEEIKNINNLEFIKDKTFSIKEEKGKMILLNRHKPTFCNQCKRIHENENPYLIIEDNIIYFCCRRNESKEIIWTKPKNIINNNEQKKIIMKMFK